MDMLKVTKKVIAAENSKDNKEHTYYNIYLFGVAIKCVNNNDYQKLYYQVKGFLNNCEK